MRNGVLGIASTIISGLSNVVVQLLVAALLTPDAFGEFSVAAVTIVFVIGLARAGVGQTDMIRGSVFEPNGPVTAGYLASAVGACAGTAVLVIGILASNPALLMVGYGLVASSVFILQDCIRYRSFRTRRAGVSLLSDVTVLIIVVGGLILIGDALSASTALAVWTLATGVGAGVGIAMLRYLPSRPRAAATWLTSNRDLLIPAVGEYSIQATLPYVLNFVILGVGGLEALAGYRLAQLLFAVLSNVATAANNATLPWVVERGTARTAQRAYYFETGVVLAIGGLLAATIVLTPTDLAEAVFGDSWTGMLAFAGVAAVHGLANALAVPTFSLLRLLGLASFSFWVRVGSALLTLIAAILVVAAGGGALAIAWAMAIPAALAYLVRFGRGEFAIRRAVRLGEPIPVVRPTDSDQ